MPCRWSLRRNIMPLDGPYKCHKHIHTEKTDTSKLLWTSNAKPVNVSVFFLWVCMETKSLAGAALSTLPRTVWETVVEALACLWTHGPFQVCAILFGISKSQISNDILCIPFNVTKKKKLLSKFPCVVRDHLSRGIYSSSVFSFAVLNEKKFQCGWEKAEMRRRTFLLLYYLLRSPFYDKYSE